ncbi:MAG: carbon-nitrogen hydrolase family protein [Mycetocola sp.]
MRVAIGQMSVGLGARANLATIGRLVDEAVADGATLVVFPEGAMASDADVAKVVATAQPMNGEFVTALRELAADRSIALVAGTWEADGEATFNTSVSISADGEIVATYRKVHLFDAFGFRESEFVTPSSTFAGATFETAETTFGLITCYDLRFPESSRIAVDAGARVLLAPAAWVPGPRKLEHWRVLARARAIENTCFVVAANQALPFGIGHSIVVDPNGEVVAELGDAEEIVTVDLDLDAVDATRVVNPSLANRRFHVVPTGTDG